jgi:hypothetical protein
MKDFFAIVGIILLIIGVALAGVLFAGWLVMLGIGILAGSGVVPATMAFGDAIWLGVIVSILIGSNAASSKS